MELLPTTTVKTSFVLATGVVATIAAILGITPEVFILTFLLFALDTVTGAMAAWREGTFSSGTKGFGRGLLKAFGYMAALFVAAGLGWVAKDLNLPEWMQFLTVNGISLLIIANESISIIENTIRLGVSFPPATLEIIKKFKIIETKKPEL